MNEINSFTFYKNYYELLDNLPQEDKLQMLEAIVDYVFKDKEPVVNGLNKAIWNNLKMPIDTSKNNSVWSVGKGAPKGNKNAQKNKPITNRKQTKNKPKTNQKGNRKQTNNISYFLFLFSNINISNLNNKDNIYKLLNEYLELRIKNKYTVNETVVNRLINKLNDYGKTDKEKEEIIKDAINGAWKDFYQPKIKKEILPDWFDKEIKEEKIEDEELTELIKKYE